MINVFVVDHGSTDNKVRPQSGSPNLGSGVTFSIPQFGDFFHDMVCRTRLTQFESSLQYTPVQVNGTTNNPSLFPVNGFNADGSQTADAAGYLPTYTYQYIDSQGVTHTVVAPAKFYNLVDAFGNRVATGGSGTQQDPLAVATQFRNLVRYCEYPGNRLFQDVKFDVNGNPLDEYDDVVPVFLTKFCLPPNKVVGFNKLVGQEVPLQGYGTLRQGAVTDLDAANTPQGIQLDQQGHGYGLFNNPPPGGWGNGSGASSTNPSYLAGLTPPTGAAGTFTAAPLYWDANTKTTTPCVPLNGTYPGAYPVSNPGANHPLPPFANFIQSSGLIPFAALNSTPDPVVDVSRELKQIVDGPQTPKYAQPPLEIWNKLR
ncbi:MAG: hypothetical protein KGL39_40775 [Patescibacteria group bacterium]|nr:hypothetical protein [Patescibacteria group bacterium]